MLKVKGLSTRFVLGAVPLALFGAIPLLLVAAGTALAECPYVDPWPPFKDVATTAKTVIVGEVVESLFNDPADEVLTFRFRIDQVLRGDASGVMTFEGLQTGEGLNCPHDSYLRVQVGDVLAIATDGVLPTLDAGYDFATDLTRPNVAVAYVHGEPNLSYMPGIQSLTLPQVRSIVLPETDTDSDRSSPTSPALGVHGLVLVVLVGATAIYLLDRRLTGGGLEQSGRNET